MRIQEQDSHKLYYDLPKDELDQVAVEDGFLEFFTKILGDDEQMM